MRLSDRIKGLSESQTIAMAKKSRELKESGVDIISLSLGEPDFTTPDFVKEAAKKAIDDDFSYYTPVPGYADLRQSIVEKLKRDNQLEYNIDQIVVSTGAKQAIINAIMCLINPGDEVIIPAPYWVSYVAMVEIAGGVPIIVPAGVEQDFKMTPQQLEKAITPKSRILLYSSPCNPSGSIYTEEELMALAKVIKEHQDLTVISDEIYELITYSGKVPSIASIEGMKDRTVIINGLSKGFAMTGWRLGYMAAPKELASACDKMQGQFTSATSSITQRAAIAAMKADPSELEYMRSAFEKRRDLVIAGLKQMPGLIVNTPQGAFYAFPDVSAYFGKSVNGKTIENATDLSLYLLEEANVSTVTGDAFGAPNCIRLSYATSETVLNEALNRLNKAFTKLWNA
ncbi:MAG: pyridoxal phosphate-dependent aminotransferase [Cryomorphaceae bacterium]|nr:pyridoxal phosphate-dependent aminotransferase [Cryomorphaceae bacterium]